MKTIQVWYKDQNVGFLTQPGDTLSKVAEFQVPEDVPEDINTLEKLWRAFNVVDGNEVNMALRIRSMCMGDQVVIGDKTFEADFVGWKELPAAVPHDDTTYAIVNAERRNSKTHLVRMNHGWPVGTTACGQTWDFGRTQEEYLDYDDTLALLTEDAGCPKCLKKFQKETAR